MPYKNPEDRRANDKKYREANREKIRQTSREWAERNREKERERQREISKTDKEKKRQMIKSWKHYGIISEDFDILYEKYLQCEKCEWCKTIFNKKRYIEHNHYSGEIRGIVCQSCNLKQYHRKDKIFIKVLEELTTNTKRPNNLQ